MPKVSASLTYFIHISVIFYRKGNTRNTFKRLIAVDNAVYVAHSDPFQKICLLLHHDVY